MHEEIFIPLIVFFFIYLTIKLLVEANTRNKLIKQGLVDEKVKYLFEGWQRQVPLNNLKWGMVLLGIGLALMLRQWAWFYVSDEAVFGLMFIFAGIGFLVYYFISQRQLKDHQSGPQA